MVHHWRIEATANAGASWSRPTLTQRFVARHVVDAVRDGFADRLAGKVVHADRLRRARRLPFPPRILEIADQFLLLRIDGDHRLLLIEERRGGRVDVLELRVPIRMRRALLGFAQRLESVPERMQQMAHRRRTHVPALRRQGRGQLRAALAGPSQRRHGIAPRQRFHQQVQRLGHAGLRVFHVGTPGSGLANPFGQRHAARKLSPPMANRLPRQPGRRGHQAVPTGSNGGRFRGRPETPRPLIEQRGHRHELAHDGRFHVSVAFHRTGLRTDLCTLAS